MARNTHAKAMMEQPRCVRIFYSETEAKYARKMLETGGIRSYITEDTFEELRLPDLGMLPRYRLYIDKADIPKAGAYLAQKLKKNRAQKK